LRLFIVHLKDAKHEHGSMTDKCSQIDSPVEAFTTDSARQRWELFHRAIAYAKKSNSAALQESEIADDEPKRGKGILSIAR
jgi:hypothetical protein